MMGDENAHKILGPFDDINNSGIIKIQMRKNKIKIGLLISFINFIMPP